MYTLRIRVVGHGRIPLPVRGRERRARIGAEERAVEPDSLKEDVVGRAVVALPGNQTLLVLDRRACHGRAHREIGLRGGTGRTRGDVEITSRTFSQPLGPSADTAKCPHSCQVTRSPPARPNIRTVGDAWHRTLPDPIVTIAFTRRRGETICPSMKPALRPRSLLIALVLYATSVLMPLPHRTRGKCGRSERCADARSGR